MVRNNISRVKYFIEDHGVKGKQQISTYEEIKEILQDDKYDVQEIIEQELKITV